MTTVFHLFLLACSICHCLSLKHANTPCTPTGLCRCVFPDNQGIDAKKLTSQFHVNLTSNLQLIYNPCKDAIIQNGTDCSLSSLCLVESVGGNQTYTHIGSAKDASMVWPRISELPKFVYRGTPTQKKQTEIRLTCSEDGSDSLQLLGVYDSSQDHILLELKSEQVCLQYVMAYGGAGGPSAASLIAIVILVIFILYFVGGYLVLRFIRGAEGIEAIPNHEFWMSLPQKIREGFLYLLNGCQTPPSYDRI